jgi:transposase
MTYSTDFRRKALSIKQREHLSFEAIAERFGVGQASVVRWSKQIQAKRTRNKPATKIDMEALKQEVEQYPDAYQYERAERLGVSRRGIGYALKRLGVSQKTFSPPKAKPTKREYFVEQIETYQNEGRHLVCMDESGFANDMPRQHGYAPIGTRCIGKHDWHAQGRINAIGALLASCLLTVSLFTTTMDTNTFYAWLEQDLLPKLPPNSVVIMDNATFHKRADIRQLLEQAGHILE